MSEFDQDLVQAAQRVLDLGNARGKMVATAESCTGGLIGGAITSLSGSSAVYDRGIISYSNEAKNELLNVPKEILAAHGAVSEQIAIAMVKGLLACSIADIGISVTGVAGPTGGTPEKPVGLVYIGYGSRDGSIKAERCMFDGDRTGIRRQTIIRALELAASLLDA